MTGSAWTVVFAAAAERDIRGIRRWSIQQFGKQRTIRYMAALLDVARRLQFGPAQPGVRRHSALPEGMVLMRAPPARERGRHVLLLRPRPTLVPPRIEVLRVLHLKMDLPRHVPARKLANPRRPG